MSGTVADHPKVKALKDAFGANLRIDGDGGPDPKNCILVREVKVYEGTGDNRRLIRDQIVIQALNDEGKPVSFHGAKWDKDAGTKLIGALPELGPQLTGGEKTHRRQKLASIVPSVASNPNIHAIESLTPNVPLTSNPKASDFTVKNEKSLPTMLTWIDATDPEKPRRVIVLIEQNVGSLEGPGGNTNRVDMATISYEMGSAEKAAFRDGGGWKAGFASDGLRPSVIEGTNVRVKNVDPNGYIGGDKAVEHHKKTINSALACLNFLNETFRFKALGEVKMQMIDILQNPSEVRSIRNVDTGEERVRPAVRAPEVDQGEMRTVSTATVTCDYDKSHSLTGTRRITSDVVRRYKNIDGKGLAEIKDALARLHRFVGEVAPRPVTRLRPR